MVLDLIEVYMAHDTHQEMHFTICNFVRANTKTVKSKLLICLHGPTRLHSW